MKLAAAILIDGVIDASWLFIVAVGLTLVFGVLNILNFAHGSLFAVGAYAAASAVGWYYGGDLGPPFLGYLLMLGSALAVALILGPLLERGVLQFFYRRDEVVLVLVTYALFLILEDATKLIWGAESYYASEPYALLGNVSFFGLSYVGYDFALIGLALVAGFLLWFGLNRTVTGKIVLAVIHDRDISRAMGVNVTRVFAFAFTLGVFLAALGGAFTAPKFRCSPASASRDPAQHGRGWPAGWVVEGAAIAALCRFRPPRPFISCRGRNSSSPVWSWRWCWHFGPRAVPAHIGAEI